MRALHQFLPTLEPGAVGAHALEVQAALRGAGVESEVYAEHVDPRWTGRARPFTGYGSRWPAGRDDVLCYQMAIGSRVADFVLDRGETKVVDHHNITPPEHFEGWEPDVVHGLRWGYHQLTDLARVVDLGLADSAFNADELVRRGCVRTEVVPILLDLDSFDREVDEEARARLEDDKRAGGVDVLFVGRVAPHKAQHDLVKALAVLRRVYDPRARLRIVGAPASDRYAAALRRFVSELGLDEAVDLAGGVGPGVLAAYYRTADVYVSASEHEGFCVPLLEAWHHGIPIVAYGATAVPETLDAAGVLLDDKSPAHVAATVARVVDDPVVRSSLVASGRERLGDFALDVTRARLLDALLPLLRGEA